MANDNSIISACFHQIAAYDSTFKRYELARYFLVVRFNHMDPPMQRAATNANCFFSVIAQVVEMAIGQLLLNKLHMVSDEIIASDRYYYSCHSSLPLLG